MVDFGQLYDLSEDSSRPNFVSFCGFSPVDSKIVAEQCDRFKVLPKTL